MTCSEDELNKLINIKIKDVCFPGKKFDIGEKKR